MNKSFIIPEFARVTNIKIQDNLITVYYEPIEPQKEFIPKDGDFCTLKNKATDNTYLFIYKYIDKYDYHCHVGFWIEGKSIAYNSKLGNEGILIPATESEKQTLLSEIDKAGFVWNAEKKRIEKKRWRAEIGDEYCYNDNEGSVLCADEDIDDVDDNRYEIGNYFQTSKQAAEFGNLSKELAFHFHQEDEVLTKIKELLK